MKAAIYKGQRGALLIGVEAPSCGELYAPRAING